MTLPVGLGELGSFPAAQVSARRDAEWRLPVSSAINAYINQSGGSVFCFAQIIAKYALLNLRAGELTDVPIYA